MRRPPKASSPPLGRRSFLTRLAALALGLGIVPLFAKKGREPGLSLREADFYRPHHRAG